MTLDFHPIKNVTIHMTAKAMKMNRGGGGVVRQRKSPSICNGRNFRTFLKMELFLSNVLTDCDRMVSTEYAVDVCTILECA